MNAAGAGGSGGSGSCSVPGSGSQSSDVVEEQRQDVVGELITRPPRHTSSKYDFVKVRVWLGDNSDHYYVLSRFLVSRMLTVTKIPNHVAIKISLELKKLLIDNSLLDVSQSDLEANLFKLMERRGYGSEYISRYKMMTRFYHQRVPLIIMVCGTACVGKSTIATQLAQRLNLPNVLQTDMVYELLRTATDAPLASAPIWTRDFSSPEELITEFCRECRIVRKGLDGDLKKAMKDGKPVIIEGIHLDPAIYLTGEKNGGVTISQPTKTPLPDLGTLSVEGPAEEPEVGVDQGEPAGPSEDDTTKQTTPESAVEKTGNAPAADSEPSSRSEQHQDSAAGHSSQSEIRHLGDRKAKGHLQVAKPPTESKVQALPRSIVVPIVLKMADVDHQTLLEEWIACRSTSDSPLSEEEKEALITKLRIIQDYISSFETQGMCVVNMSATTFPQTMDWLHSYLLECIEQGCAAPSPGAGPDAVNMAASPSVVADS